MGKEKVQGQRGLLQRKKKHSRRKLAEFMPDHVLRDQDIDVILPIVDLKLMPHKIREDGGSARHCSDGRRFLARLGARDWEPSA